MIDLLYCLRIYGYRKLVYRVSSVCLFSFFLSLIIDLEFIKLIVSKYSGESAHSNKVNLPSGLSRGVGRGGGGRPRGRSAGSP